MGLFATVTLASHGVELRCPDGDIREDRPFGDEDARRLRGWADLYTVAAKRERQDDVLLAIGREMHDWLNGADAFLTRALDFAASPLLLEIRVSRGDCERENAKALLDAPWELLASEGVFWALRSDRLFCPVRRIGQAGVPPKPSPRALGLVFMAAAPRGADNLNHEAEEAAILTATKHLPMDFVVEESGTLDLLSACVAREKPDVIQISCHGSLYPTPGLLLEDEYGDERNTEAKNLFLHLIAHHPRLLFLSACQTAQADPVLPSLARSLTLAGMPAVLGWAESVGDHEATLFASLFYSRLCNGEDLAESLACARLELADHKDLPENPGTGPRSQDWHLARLFFSGNGGGSLATAGGPRRRLGRGFAVKAFLDAKGKQVPVAGELEFVGRRRQIQDILREFRVTAGKRHTGAIIHGIGRQGKSSLAARVAQRLEATHETVVIYGRYDAPFILRTLADRLGTQEVADIVSRHMKTVEENKASLLPALKEILSGPCAQAIQGKGKPVLLVVDDFEQAIEEKDRHSLKPEYIESIRALLMAFAAAQTDSRLLFTSRYWFTCPYQGKDLADSDHLLDVPLHGMEKYESRKQALAKLRLLPIEKLAAEDWDRRFRLIEGAIEQSRGNPGLQDLLFRLASDDPAACERCLLEMERFIATKTLPEEEEVQKFLENLALQSLIDLLSTGQRELIRAATLFSIPVPIAVFSSLADSLGCDGDKDMERLRALGLLETYEDLYDPRVPALALNALVRPLAGELNEKENTALAKAVTQVLFDQWGGDGKENKRGMRQDFELTRLGLMARNALVLAAAGAGALRFQNKLFEWPQAAAWAKDILAIVIAAEAKPTVDLLRMAALCLQQVGDVESAREFRDRALKCAQEDKTVSDEDLVALLLDHARDLNRQGKIPEALQYFTKVQEMAMTAREKAIVLGEIARIRAAKGEVDAALKLDQEALVVCEELGDKMGRAVTLGDIARIRAGKGEVDAALELHQERLGIFEALGDKRSRAVTLGDIARIRAGKGEMDAALQLLQEMLGIFAALGDTRSRAVTLGDIARIRGTKGEVDTAMQLHQERLGIFEALGDKRERAVTLGDIARIRAGKGEVDAALELHQERLGIFKELGNKREHAVTLGDIARIRAANGEVDAALQLHQERLGIFEALGAPRSYAVTLGDIARIQAEKGEVDTALQLHQERLGIFEALGDKWSRAVTLGDIARIRAGKGEVDVALELHQEELAVYEELGDKRSRAVTLGDIARIRADKGEVDTALELHQERLGIFEALGDLGEKAHTFWSIAKIEIQQEKWKQAFTYLAESYFIYLNLGRLEGICVVGVDLGQLLVMAGDKELGVVVLTRSRDGFIQLGQTRRAEQVQTIIDRVTGADG